MDSALIDKKDLELLKELGFRRSQTPERMRCVLDNKLRMRQLDQLKMMFFRMSFMDSELFSTNVKRGIMQNDLNAYSQAINILFAQSQRKKKSSKGT